MPWKQVEPRSFKFTEEDGEVIPVATLEYVHNDEPTGAHAHIYIDDGCYVLAIANTQVFEGDYEQQEPKKYRNTTHWFSEAVKVLQALPPPLQINSLLVKEIVSSLAKEEPSSIFATHAVLERLGVAGDYLWMQKTDRPIEVIEVTVSPNLMYNGHQILPTVRWRLEQLHADGIVFGCHQVTEGNCITLKVTVGQGLIAKDKLEEILFLN